MTEEKLESMRQRLRPRLINYLKTARVEYYPPALTVCPVCNAQAGILFESLWHCTGCGRKGDAVDYARELHGFKSEQEAVRYLYRLLHLELTEFELVSANALMEAELRPKGYLIDRLLHPGVFLLAGASKVGKSWLVLWLAHCVSLGKPVWELQTRQCSVLYLSLEDTPNRMQQRLDAVTGGQTGQIYIGYDAELLGRGFEKQLTNHLLSHPDTGLVIVDTLQRIRPPGAERYSYAGDYETVTLLKGIANRFDVTILLVHHTRKQAADDPYLMISGTTGLLGSADGAMVLQKDRRMGRLATLDATGREIMDIRLLLEFDEQQKRWLFRGFGEDTAKEPTDELLEAVRSFMENRDRFQGTASELLTRLKERNPRLDLQPNVLTRRLNRSRELLRALFRIQFRSGKRCGERTVELRRIGLTDSDGVDDIDGPGGEPEKTKACAPD